MVDASWDISGLVQVMPLGVPNSQTELAAHVHYRFSPSRENRMIFVQEREGRESEKEDERV